MIAETFELKELAKLLKFNSAYCKMMLKKMGVDPTVPIDENVAAELAGRLSRPWPPQAS